VRQSKLRRNPLHKAKRKMSFAIHLVFSTSINHCHRHRSELGLGSRRRAENLTRKSDRIRVQVTTYAALLDLPGTYRVNIAKLESRYSPEPSNQ